MEGKVSKKIISEAEKEANKIKKDAREEADRIIKEAKEKAETIISEGNKRAESLLQQEKERLIGIERLEEKKKILEEKREIFENVFVEALEEFKKWNKDRYVGFISRWVLKNLEKGDETLLVGKLHQKDVIDKLNELKKEKNLRFTISTENSIELGCIIESGRKRILITPDSIKETLMEILDRKIVRVLFGNAN